jgi:hypothetical protein
MGATARGRLPLVSRRAIRQSDTLVEDPARYLQREGAERPWQERDFLMISGTHAIIYASDAAQARAFFRDVLGMPNIDVHDGWLIFKMPPAELGIHPAGDASPGGHHELYFICDDVEATV